MIVVMTALGPHYRAAVEGFPVAAFIEKPLQPDAFTATLARVRAARQA
jgi:hypothetical protein